MFANKSPIAALMAALVLLAAVGPTVAAQSATAPTSIESTNDTLTDLDASNAASVHVSVYTHDDQLIVEAHHEADGTALVTVEALDGSFAGDGTYEIDGHEKVVLDTPDESTTLKISVETEQYEGSFLVDFERQIVACSDEEFTILRPIVVEGSSSVEAKSTLADTSVDSSSVLRANASYPDPPVECEVDELPNESDGNETADDVRENYNDTRDEAESTYEETHDETREAYDETHDEVRERYEDGREDARSGVGWASSFVSQIYHDVINFGKTAAGDAREDADVVREDAREDARTIRDDANETGEQLRDDAEKTGERAREDAEETSKSVSADADASASVDSDATVDDDGASASGQADASAEASADTSAGSANAEVGIVGQIRAMIGGFVG